MSLENKIAENMNLAEYCFSTHKAFSPGVSRAYYASYQCAKRYLLAHGVTEDNYREKAVAWNIDLTAITNYSPFGHETIWRVLKGYLIAARKGVGFRVPAGEALRDERIKADYHEEEHLEPNLAWSIKVAQGIIKDLT